MARPARPNAQERARRKLQAEAEALADVCQLSRQVQLLEADVVRAHGTDDADRLLCALAARREALQDAELKLRPAHALAMHNRARHTADPQHSGADA